jgi:GTP-binding protein
MQKRVSDLKIYYATQAFTAPPKFIFFINKKEFLKKDFYRFIEKKLREAFEFRGTPVRIVFREKERGNLYLRPDRPAAR